jgi:hypothetical protein
MGGGERTARVNGKRTDLEVTRYLADYAAVTSYDSALRDFRLATGDHKDLLQHDHRVAVIEWFRAWGCRRLRRVNTDRTSTALRQWWEAPTLDGAELLIIEGASDALRSAFGGRPGRSRAAKSMHLRRHGSREGNVRGGTTGHKPARHTSVRSGDTARRRRRPGGIGSGCRF